MFESLCNRQREHFSDHLDGVKLPPWRRFFVRFHLKRCPRCIRYQRSLVATREALKALRDDDPR